LSLLLLDADSFKAYNDMYGHPAGDEVLRTIASCIRAGLCRPTDLAARYGGEEFAVLLPGAGPLGAMLVAERIRGEVAARAVPHAAAASGLVSVSLGVASAVPGDGDQAASLIERADAALYRAKRLGRNRTETCAETCAEADAAPENAGA
jgi:diguanylate cyclase (GGDEF)-like protein